MSEINIDKLKRRLRSDFQNNVIPIIKKDYCESCGCEENLEVHHIKPFIEQFNECMQTLKTNNEDLIRTYMIGMQIINKNITVCNTCHSKIHKLEHSGFYGCGNTNWDEIVKKRKLINDIKIENEISQIEEYIKSIVGRRLFSDDMKVISEKFNKISRSDYRSKNIQTSRVNKIMEKYNMPYVLKNRETSKYEDSGIRKKIRFKQFYKI